MTAQNLSELDRLHFFHPFTSIAEQMQGAPQIFSEARGILVKDIQGREYIDAMAGLWCVNVGYGREEIADAVAAQIRTLSYCHAFAHSANEAAIRLAERLAGLAPGPLNRVFFGCTGSDANETQIKLVWQYNNLLGRPRRKKIIARRGAYHGVTLGAVSMSGLPHLHAQFDVPLERFVHVEKPHYFWREAQEMTEREFTAFLAKDLEDTIEREGADTIAAFIAEPIMGAGGVIVPPSGYFDAVLPILRKHKILFIADEVICGFGRLGKWFGSNRYGIQPDLMTVAKGITSGYVPLSACIVSDPIWEVFRDASPEKGPFSHGFTYSAHPVAAAAALANLDIMEREALVDNAAKVGMHFQQQIRDAFNDHPLVGEVRGIGLIAGIELVADKAKRQTWDPTLHVARRLHILLRDEGLLCRPIGNTLAFSPPLVVTRDDIHAIVERFARGLDRLTAELKAEGRI